MASGTLFTACRINPLGRCPEGCLQLFLKLPGTWLPFLN